MSCSASASVVASGGGGEVGYGGRPPFTAVQWQELEHQAMIYKYLVAGLPVPPDLVMPIRQSFGSLSAPFFQYPSLGYRSYYGKKFDPEPGRCRRTDGKKWRCSKEAHPESKYCERHMHRGRNRSRKPVESQTSSHSMSTAIPHISARHTGNSGSFPSMAFYTGGPEGSTLGGDVTKLQIQSPSFGIHDKELRYIHGLAPDSDENSFSPEASVSVASLGLSTGADSNTWNFIPSQVSSKFSDHSISQQNILPPVVETMDVTMSKQLQQHCFFDNEIVSPGSIKQQNPVHPFFSEWPTTKESWSNLDGNIGANKNAFSSTQLSISIPRNSEFSSRGSYSPRTIPEGQYLD